MTDYLEDAATRAVELAQAMTSKIADFPGDRVIAAHLTYLAGLIRGGAVPPAVPPGPCPVEMDGLLSGKHLTCRLRAGHQGVHETEDGATFRYSHHRELDPIETDAEAEAAQGEVEELRRQLKLREVAMSSLKRELTTELDELREKLLPLRNLQKIAEQEATDYRKRWHEAATQRDALVRAARELLRDETMVQTTRVDRLRAVVEQVGANFPFPATNADRLRRELWAVLDRMPASDDDLIAAVRGLKGERDAFIPAAQQRDEAIRQRKKTADVMERVRAQRDELLAAIETFIDAPAEWGPRADLAKAANHVLSDRA